MRLCLLLTLTVTLLPAQKPARVFVISLDGMGYQAFTEDPVASELKTMRRLAAEGIHAPAQAAFPSQTAPGHASLFTGVYGNQSGITSNNIPDPDRFGKTVTGFRAEHLKAETFWVKAARAGIRSVAHNPTQGFPCTEFNSGPNVTLVNGYQTAEVAPHRLIRAKDVEWLAAAPAGFAMPPKSRQPVRYFRYSSGRIQFLGVLFARGLRYDTVRLTAQAGKRYVDAALKDAESEPVRVNNGPARPLARHFSEALPVANLTALHFRLFEANADGSDFLLYQTEAREVSVCHNGAQQDTRFRERLLNTSGAFIGNGAGTFYTSGAFGPIDTNGIAERRWLETLELHARQTMRHSRALLDEFDPRLFVDYLSTTDDMLHTWWPKVVSGSKENEPWRRWGYQIIDWRIEQLRQLLDLERDHLIIVSDHGMTDARRQVRVNTILKSLGLSDRVMATSSFVRLKDRSDTALLAEVHRKLDAFRDEGKPVFASWYWPAEHAAKFGIGGDNGGDLYFDLAPGYEMSNSMTEPAVTALSPAKGVHGMLPTRSELMALFLAAGPELHSRAATMRTVDVAPFVMRLLGL